MPKLKRNLLKNFYFDQRGFGLLSIVIASAIGIIMAASYATLLLNQYKLLKGIELKDHFNQLSIDLNTLLSNPTTCQAIFANKTFNPLGGFPQPINEIVVNGNIILSINPPNNVRQGVLRTEKIEFVNRTEDPVINLGGNTYLASIYIELKSIIPVLGTNTFIKLQKIQMTIDPTATPANQIVNCVGQSNAVFAKPLFTNCQRMTATTHTKISCGWVSSVMCPAGYYAVSGGMVAGGNGALQDINYILSGGRPVGIQISQYDAAGCGTTSGAYATVLCCQ